ncbi:histone deacetylase family protein [Aminobacter sp. AP02]|uniref:histone deacetylase family protein n=1 Tax=Aminobacter sp. AP02 TaxID=2135737 RepID=UPI000D6CD3E2|nr:histone deacetylase family protein [Aminobacter sp. AP02]PWK76144.1 acetoin utilization deacetylase AcuC-like enzyme [Aminobacter sp. AP02]
MKTFYAAEQKRHDPKAFLSMGAQKPNPEQPERVERLLLGARGAGSAIHRPANYGLGPIAAVHTPEYIEFLTHIFERWQRMEGASAEVIPNIHPIARNGTYPAGAAGQAGYHMADTACPISAETFESACWSAWSAVAATEAVLSGEPAAYALCRPPGHHAFADVAGGFCFFNNSAIAAQRLRATAARVAILDVDLHHGNGTQGIFYNRADVLTVSLHADPSRFYPFFWGHADERGEGAGLGYNCNLPLPRKSGDAEFLEALGHANRRIRAFAPDALVVALGLDAFEGDPFGGLSVTTSGFSRIAEAIAKLGLPTVIVQEGGYLCDALGDNLTAFLTSFAGTN